MPRARLEWLLAASVGPDVVDYILAFAGVYNPHGLYSHSLPAIAVQGCLMALAVLWQSRSTDIALLVFALVLLHLAADLVTGDKLLWRGGNLTGLRLYWRLPVLDFMLEMPIVIVGWFLLRSVGTAPRWATSVLTMFALLLLQSFADFSSYRKPRAPSVSVPAPARAKG